MTLRISLANETRLNAFANGLLFVVVIELVVGGGRLINFGTVSLRMILFAVAIFVAAIYFLLGYRIRRKYLYLLLVFTAMLAIGVLIGLVEGADKNLIWEDVKPLLFFYILPFFSITLGHENDLKNIGKTIIISAMVMAIAFLIILALILTKAIPFLSFWNLTYPTGEFFFRGQYTFFYKGFIYLCIGLLFTHFIHVKKYKVIILILSMAIFLSFTRGLILALGLSYTVYYLFIRKFYRGTILALTGCIIIFFFGKELYSVIGSGFNQLYQPINAQKTAPQNLLGDREFSDNARKLQIREVVKATTWSSAVVGHGFGNGLPSRPVHMEISYLEIFHKQGLVGIGCWLFILTNLLISFKSITYLNSTIGTAFFLSALFVCFQSLTNQYMNNPIGMGMILLSQVSLDVLSKNEIHT